MAVVLLFLVSVACLGLTGNGQATTGCATQEKNVNLAGNDLNINGTTTGVGKLTYDECCELCNSLATEAIPCRFFSYRSDLRMCHPKYSDSGRSTRPGTVSSAAGVKPKPYSGQLPNIVFLIDESTDGRTYNPDPENTSAMYIPNIRKLQEQGAYFSTMYSNSPVCAPSRTSLISGRHVHRIPHTHNGVQVNGAWNNAEGNPNDFSLKWIDVLMQTTNVTTPIGDNHGLDGQPAKPNEAERQIKAINDKNIAGLYKDPGSFDGELDNVPYIAAPTFGKTDWTVGGHAVWNWLQCWTMYTEFPYNVTDPDFRDPTKNGSGIIWSEQPEKGACREDGTVDQTPNQTRTHIGDWVNVDKNAEFLRTDAASLPAPWFVYHGLNIVHPGYTTSQYWMDKINRSKIDVPEWAELEDLHPCDFQSSMLKGCIPPTEEKVDFYSMERRKTIIQIYFAMIAEYDSMVGEYVSAVEDAGLTHNTYFILTSDHGDMRMQHQQFYKMVSWEASTRVPLVIAGPGVVPGKVYRQPTSLLDIYPTVLAMASRTLPSSHPGLDGYSLLSLVKGEMGDWDQSRPDWVMSQGHMADNAMSWYLIRQREMKLIVWGTGQEHPYKLYNISADPDENYDLSGNPQFAGIAANMTAILESAIDYKSVSMDVADYNLKMFTQWYAIQNGTKGTWKDWISRGDGGNPSGLPGGGDGTAWPADLIPAGIKAMEEWLAGPPKIKPCRDTTWTPAS